MVLVVGTAVYAAHPAVRALPTASAPERRGAGGLFGLELVFGAMALMFTGLGAVEVLLVARSDALGHAAWAGPLLGAMALGSAAGGLVHGSRVWPGTAAQRLRLFLVVFGLAAAAMAPARSIAALALVAPIAGAALSPAIAAVYEMLQEVAGSSTEAGTRLNTSLTLGASAGAAIGGVLADGGALAATALVAGGLVLAGATWRPAPRRAGAG